MGKEKKEIGKLIELLNEWSKTAIENKCNWTDVYDEEGVYFLNLFYRDMTMGIEDVISKRNGFIKWLVENDKIDLGEKLFNLTKNDNRKSIICDLDNNDFSWGEDTFLMLLSISSSPIDDLILYLK